MEVQLNTHVVQVEIDSKLNSQKDKLSRSVTNLQNSFFFLSSFL